MTKQEERKIQREIAFRLFMLTAFFLAIFSMANYIDTNLKGELCQSYQLQK